MTILLFDIFVNVLNKFIISEWLNKFSIEILDVTGCDHDVFSSCKSRPLFVFKKLFPWKADSFPQKLKFTRATGQPKFPPEPERERRLGLIRTSVDHFALFRD